MIEESVGLMEYDETKDTYNRIARRWADAHSDAKFLEPEYAKMVKYAGHGAYLLDVGCGPGRDAGFFAHVGYSVIGIDFSDGMLAEARRRVQGVAFINMDMRSLEFGDGAFDALWCNASLLHIRKADAGGVLDGFARVLKKGGVAFLAVKKGEGEEMRVSPDGRRRFFAYYKDGELETALAAHGFEVMETGMKTDDEGNIWICVFAKRG